MRTAMRALNIPRCKHRLWSPACSHRTRLQSTVLSAVRQMFVQRINQVTGDAEWVVVEDPGAGKEGDAAVAVVAASSYLDMLTDNRRNLAYRVALEKAATKLHQPPAAKQTQQAKNADTRQCPLVVDIGTGTGLLAMMAARAVLTHTATTPEQHPTSHLQHQQKSDLVDSAGQPSVIACELFPPMAGLAQRVIAHNNLDPHIKVVLKRSDELTVASATDQTNKDSDNHNLAGGASSASAAGSVAAQSVAARRQHGQGLGVQGGETGACDMPRKCDLIVTEIFDSELLGEGILPTMRHAVQHLLQDGGHIIPASATVWGQVVESPLLWGMSGLGGAEQAAATASKTSTDPARSMGHGSGFTEGVGSSGEGGCTLSRAVVAALAAMEAEVAAHVMHGAPPSGAGACTGNDTAGVPHGDGDESSSWCKLHEVHVDAMYDASLIRPLGPPRQLLTFDFEHPPEHNVERVEVEVPMAHAGHAHALIVWWQLDMDPYDSGSLLLSTAPQWVEGRVEQGGDGGPLRGVSQQWRDHWGQCWVRLGAGRQQPLAVQPDQVVRLGVRHDDVSIQVRLEGEGAVRGGGCGVLGREGLQEGQVFPLPLPSSWLSPSRLMETRYWQHRWGQYEAALTPWLTPGVAGAAAVGGGGSSAGGGDRHQGFEVVCIGTGPVLPLLAASLCTPGHPQQVLAPQTQPPPQQMPAPPPSSSTASTTVTALMECPASQAWVTQASHRLGTATTLKPTPAAPYLRRARAVAKAAAAHSTPQQCHGSAPSISQPPPLLLLSEPNYKTAEGALPWANLRCWSEFDTLRSGQVNSGRDVWVSPGRAVVRAVAVSLPELWRSRRCLGKVEGLDLTLANAMLGVVGTPEEACGPWSPPPHSDSHAELNPSQPMDGTTASTPPPPSPDATIPPLPPLPFAVWQCGGGYREVSQRADVMCLDLAGPMQQARGSTRLHVPAGSGTVHAIVLWLDYDVTPRLSHGGIAANSMGMGKGGSHGDGVSCAEDARVGRGVTGQRAAGSTEAPCSHEQSAWRRHGIWVDRGPHAGGGPCSTMQAVMLLPQQLHAGAGAGMDAGGGFELEVGTCFDPSDGEVEVEVGW